MPENNQDKLRMAAEFDVAEPSPEPPAEAPAPKIFSREIEIGGRKQKFEAETQEALIDKLVEAQANATKKLQELSQQPKSRREPERQSSDWQELKPQVLKAEDVLQLEKNPHELFRRMYQAEFGVTPEEFRQRENERRRQEAELAAQNDFVRKYQDYNPVPENAQKIYRFLERENLPISKRNLEYAYLELRDELVPRGTSASSQSPAPVPPQPQVTPPPSFIRPSLGGRAAIDETSGGFDAAEAGRISQLPPTEMKARIEQLFRQSRLGR